MRQPLRLVDFTYVTLLGSLCVMAMPAAAQERFDEKTINGVRVWSPKPPAPAPVVQQGTQPSVTVDVESTADLSTSGLDPSGLDTSGLNTSGLDTSGLD
jgi:hypothetical protein